LAVIALARSERLCESFRMKKVRKLKMTWENLLKIEEKHPFSAGNPTGSFVLPSYKLKKASSAHKKTHSRQRELVPA